MKTNILTKLVMLLRRPLCSHDGGCDRTYETKARLVKDGYEYKGKDDGNGTLRKVPTQKYGWRYDIYETIIYETITCKRCGKVLGRECVRGNMSEDNAKRFFNNLTKGGRNGL